MHTTAALDDRYTTLADEQTIAATAAALQRRGMSVEVADDLDAARTRVLGRMPLGSSVMTNSSVTLEATGIAAAVDADTDYRSMRTRMFALDPGTQRQEMKALAGQPDFALGSAHAITRDGVVVLASALGSQLAAYAYGAARVILVVGAQKLVPDLRAAHERITRHCLPLENDRAAAAYGRPSRIGKILEIHQEDPDRIHVVLVRAVVGF